MESPLYSTTAGHRFAVFGYLLVAMLILGATVVVPMRRLWPPSDDFIRIALEQGAALLRDGAVSGNYPYPLWTQVLFLPFSLLSPQLATQLWFVCNLFLLALSLLLLMALLRWPFQLRILVLFSLLVGAYGPVFTTLWFGQLSFISLLLLVLLVYGLKSESWFVVGVLLGLSLIKPQMAFLVAVAVFPIAMWHGPWKTLFGLGMVLLVFMALSVPFVADMGDVLGPGLGHHLSSYLARTSTLWGLFLTFAPNVLWLPATVGVILVGWLAYLWTDSLRTGQWKKQVLFLTGITVLVNLLIIPYSWFYNQAILVMPICQGVDQLRHVSKKARTGWILLLVALVYVLHTLIDTLFTRPYQSDVYQVIPIALLLPALVVLQKYSQVGVRQPDLSLRP